jgi:hypothetical protein
MALSPLFWLQSGLALTDMFAMVFVVAFLLVEGMPAKTPRGALARRIACGVIAGLSLGARPHVTVLIVAYWCFRAVSSRGFSGAHLLTAVLSLLAGAALWLIPAALATGGFDAYFSASVAQFRYRLDKPAVSVLGAPFSLSYLTARAAALIGWLGQSFAPVPLARWQAPVGAVVLVPYIVFAWWSPAKAVARPYILASGLYLSMLFILLPTQHQRYFLPFVLIVGWAVAGLLVLFRRPPVRAVAAVALLALMAVPSLFLIRGLATAPPPVAALQWLRSARPHAILFAEGLSRHAAFYWPEAEMRPTPKTATACEAFRSDLASGRAMLSTRRELCGAKGSKVMAFRRDRRVHDKHHQVTLFEFGAPAP